MSVQGPINTEFLWLLLIASGVAIVARLLKGMVPYSLLLVVAGLGVGAARLLPSVHLEPHVLFTVFLPPLLFESAINLRARLLKRDWRPIAAFALLGTLLSTLLVGWTASRILNIPLPAALVFGALISATDPISVIAIFKKLGAAKRLTIIMEGESLFNDGVAVVLFGVFAGAAAAAGGATPGLAATLLGFLKVVLGGLAVGAGLGYVVSRIMKEFDDHLLEVTLTTLVAFGAYLVAEHFHVSGVVAVVVAGLVVGNYGMPVSMSPTTRMAVVSFWEFAAFVVNSIVFLLVGIEEALIDWRDALPLIAGGVLAVLVGRASIYPLAFLVNRVGGDVPTSYQHVLVWGGLRGALSMALALGLAPDFPQRSALVTATFGVVLFSLLVQGLTVGALVSRLGLAKHEGSAGAAEMPEPAEGGTHADGGARRAEMIAAEAALRELNRLQERDALPEWTLAALRQEYEARLAVSEDGASEAAGAGRPHLAPVEQFAEARRLALIAERDALHEAERQEELSGQEAHALLKRIDAEIVALTSAGGGH